MSRRLGRAFFSRPAHEVAPDLLNKTLLGPAGRAGRIVEVEAYGGADDPASHAHRGRRPRNSVMFGPPGHLYVYFSYGLHWCANVVTDLDGVAGAVLLRALTPLRGLDQMRSARGARARRDRDLCSGPAKLCEALGIDGSFDGADLVVADRGVSIRDYQVAPPPNPICTTRIGLTRGVEKPWRWHVGQVPDVSVKRVPAPHLTGS